jgi:hypothetical protein
MYCGLSTVRNALNTDDWQGGILGPDRHELELVGLLDTFRPGIVVCESFQHTQGKHAELISAEYIGIVKYWCKTHLGVGLVMQTSSEGKGFWTDDKLKACGLWKISKHTRDATRHLLTYITKTDYTYIRMLAKMHNPD